MSLSIILLLLIIAGALLLFITEWMPIDVTAILVMVALMISGILTPEEGVSGFSNAATITILALLIISESLKNTGAVEELGDKMTRIAGQREWVTLLLIMGVVAVASAFVNNTAVVAVFIPVMFRISRATGIKVPVLLIPLSFASMVGGSATMIGTSTNLLINSMATDYELSAFPLFQPLALGAILLVAVVIYILVAGRYMLQRKPKTVEIFDREVESKQYITEVIIPEGSKYVGKSLADTDFADRPAFRVLGAVLSTGESVTPESVRQLEPGDRLIIKTGVREIVEINLNPDVRIRTNELRLRGTRQNERERELFEVLIAENSNLMEQRIRDIDFLSYYDAIPLAVKQKQLRGGRQLMNHKIKYGDILLMSGIPHETDKRSQTNWITIQRFSSDEIKKELPRRDRMWVSVAIIVAVILLAVTGVLPIMVSAWAGVAAMFLTQCITLEKAYYNVEWKVIFLLAGIIPLGKAISKTGADQLIAQGIMDVAGDASLTMIVSVLFIITVVLTGIISNQATAVLLIPIAIQLASDMSLPAEPLLMTILFGASTSFLTPVGYQTNAMVLGPGNYSFTDFLKVGGLLCLIFWVLVTIFIPVIYG